MISITVRQTKILLREAFLKGHEMTNPNNALFVLQITRKTTIRRFALRTSAPLNLDLIKMIGTSSPKWWLNGDTVLKQITQKSNPSK